MESVFKERERVRENKDVRAFSNLEIRKQNKEEEEDKDAETKKRKRKRVNTHANARGISFAVRPWSRKCCLILPIVL